MATYYAKTAGTGTQSGDTATNAKSINDAVAQVNTDAVPGLIYVCADAVYNATTAYTKATQEITYIGCSSTGVVDGTRPSFTCNYDADDWFLGSASKMQVFVNTELTGGAYPSRRPLLYGSVIKFFGCRFYNFSAGLMSVGSGFQFDALCEYDTVTGNYGIGSGIVSAFSYYISSGAVMVGTTGNALIGCLVKDGRKGFRSGVISDEGYTGGGTVLFTAVDGTPDASCSGTYSGSARAMYILGSIIKSMTGYGINGSAVNSSRVSIGNVYDDNDLGEVQNTTQISDTSTAPSFNDPAGTPPDYSPSPGEASQVGAMLIRCPFEIFGTQTLNSGNVLGGVGQYAANPLGTETARWSASEDDDGNGTLVVTDLTEGGATGTISGTSGTGLWVSDTEHGGVRAWHFNGTDDAITISDDDKFSPGDGSIELPFSVSAWVKPDTSGSNQGIISKASTQTYFGEWALWQTTSGYGFSVADASTNEEIYATPGSLVVTGRWVHICGTYDGSGEAAGIKLYMDGVEVTGAPVKTGSYTALENTAFDVVIGRRRTGNDYYDGKIDDIRFEKGRVWSSDEIFALATKRGGAEPLTDQNWDDVLDGVQAWFSGENFVVNRYLGDPERQSYWYDTAGGTTTEGAGNVGRMLVISGTVAYRLQADAAALRPGTNPFYICGWINSDSATPTNGSWLFGIAGEYDLSITAAGKVTMGLVNGGTTTATSTGNISASTWHFVEGWYDGTNIYVAIDQTEDSTAYTSGCATTANLPRATHDNNLAGFNGDMEQFIAVIGVIPSQTNRDWIYNNGVGRTLEDWHRRQLRTPIEVVGGGGGGEFSFASIG